MYDFSCGIVGYRLYYFEVYSLYTQFVEYFYHEKMLNFVGSIQTSAFYFCEKCYWNFDRDCVESVDSFEECGHLNNINSSNL